MGIKSKQNPKHISLFFLYIKYLLSQKRLPFTDILKINAKKN